MATYSNVCRDIFKLEISCTSFLFKHTHNTINDNTNTCPQPLADLIWLNYRARKSGWFAINKRAKQLKQRPRTFDFSKTQTTSYCQEQQWSVHKTWWKKRRIQTQQKSSPIYTPFLSLTHYHQRNFLSYFKQETDLTICLLPEKIINIHWYFSITMHSSQWMDI